MNKIVLITTGQPSTNPRMVKEADAMVEAGYEVKVLYSYWDQWAQESDLELLADKAWQYQQLGGTPGKLKWEYLYTRLRRKVAVDGVNGYRFKVVKDMVEAVASVPYLSRVSARKSAEEKFIDQVIVAQYETLYQNLISHGAV